MKTNSKQMSQHSKNLSADWQKIKHAFADTAGDVTSLMDDVLDDSVGTIREKSADVEKSITDYTVKKPLPALGLAVLAGIAIGFWLKR